MKTVLITGVSRGIGKALAEKFLQQGFFVIGTSTKGKTDFENENFIIFSLDLNDEASIADCAKKIIALNKPLDIVINNAATWLPTDTGPSTDILTLKKTLQIDLIGQIDFTQKILPVVSSGGHIVNVSSRQGSLDYVDPSKSPGNNDPSYRIAKAGLNMFTRTLALKLNGRITVSSVHPGSVKTDMGLPTADMEPKEAADHIFKLAVSQPETGQFWFKGNKMNW